MSFINSFFLLSSDVSFWVHNESFRYQEEFFNYLFKCIFHPRTVLVLTLCLSFNKWRYQAEINVLSVGLWSLEAQKKVKLLSQINQKIRIFMHRFCCILYEIRFIIKIYSAVLVDLPYRFFELYNKVRTENLKYK